MHTNDQAPMRGGSDQQNVIVIQATQVCDFCFQEQRVERTFDVAVPGTTTPAVTCEIDERNITCREVERREIDARKNRFLVCLAVEVPVRITVGTQVIPQRIVFLKQAVLCTPPGTQIDCQVTGNCCCFFDRATNQVSCVFDFCVVIQSQVTVRVLVPTLGACTPKRCVAEAAGCPPTSPVAVCNRCNDSSGSDDRSGRCHD